MPRDKVNRIHQCDLWIAQKIYACHAQPNVLEFRFEYSQDIVLCETLLQVEQVFDISFCINVNYSFDICE